jgi:BirA family biotin operon repressor/biotin-[acetyl-CoA-carboxylase] ligase
VSQLGHPRVHLRRTDSTNERARALARGGAPHGTLVTAAEQTAGRGRGGRSWSSPPGSSVLMSLLLREPPSLLPLMAAVAVCDIAGDEARVKWPNDIVVANAVDGTGLAKLAGILTEARPQEGWAVVGIGLNVAVRLDELPPQLRPGAAQPGLGLPAATLGRTPAEVEPTLKRLLVALDDRLRERPVQTLEAWRSRDALLGREIAWGSGDTAEHGLAKGIDGTGRLVVELAEGGRTTLSAGEVHLTATG